MHAHNEWIQILHDGGIFMVVLVIGYLTDLIRRIFYTNPSTLLIGYIVGMVSFIVISCAGFPLRIGSLALIGVLYITCLEILTRGDSYV